MGEGPSNQQTPALWGLHGQFMVAVQHNLNTTNNNPGSGIFITCIQSKQKVMINEFLRWTKGDGS